MAWVRIFLFWCLSLSFVERINSRQNYYSFKTNRLKKWIDMPQCGRIFYAIKAIQSKLIEFLNN